MYCKIFRTTAFLGGVALFGFVFTNGANAGQQKPSLPLIFFKAADKNHDGFIDLNEARDLKVRKTKTTTASGFSKTETLSDPGAEFMRIADTSRDGRISPKEFDAFMSGAKITKLPCKDGRCG